MDKDLFRITLQGAVAGNHDDFEKIVDLYAPLIEHHCYGSISTNLKRFFQLLVSGCILFLCVFLCLYLIEDAEISLAAGVGAAVLAFGVIITPVSYTHLNRYDRRL